MRREHRRAEQANSFGAAAAAYQRSRPSYPTAAVDWLLVGGAKRVLDLGAGTGKLTGQLWERGLDVVAVEPSLRMRQQLAQAVPEARLLPGTAEQIPIADGSVDAVLAAQAWHWVDPHRAVPEVARVLAPAGWLGLLWNMRDESEGWVADLGRIMRSAGADDSDALDPHVGPPFGPIERHQVTWRHRLACEAILDLVASRSYVITMPPDARAALLAEVRRLLATHPDLAGRTEVELPYVTHCFRTQLQ